MRVVERLFSATVDCLNQQLLTPKWHKNSKAHSKKVIEEFAQFGKIARILEQPHPAVLIAGANGTHGQLTGADFISGRNFRDG